MRLVRDRDQVPVLGVPARVLLLGGVPGQGLVSGLAERERIPINPRRSKHRPFCKQARNPALAKAIRARDWPAAFQLLSNNIGILYEQDHVLRASVQEQAPMGIVGQLVERNLDVDAADGEGKSALYFAVQQNRLELVEYFLFMCKGNARMVDCCGQGLAHVCLAGSGTSLEMLELLIKFGADARLQDLEGRTPLSLCTNPSLAGQVESLLG